MDDRYGFEDVLGFTRQTKLLLTGLGNENLIDEAKRRNLSTEDLAKLTIEDLIVLGVDENVAESIKNSLSKLVRKSAESNWISLHRSKHLVEVLRDGQRHLKLISSYLKFCRYRLINDRNKKIDNDAEDSHALHVAAQSVLAEFYDLRKKFFQLNKKITKKDDFEKAGYVKTCVLISALGLTGSIIFYIYKK